MSLSSRLRSLLLRSSEHLASWLAKGSSAADAIAVSEAPVEGVSFKEAVSPKRSKPRSPSKKRRKRRGRSEGLTPLQQAVYDHVREFNREHGFSPSYPEIAEACGIAIGNVHVRILALEKKGLITRDPTCTQRKIRLLKDVGGRG